MSLQSPVMAPPIANLTEAVMMPHGELLRPPLPTPPPSVEQVQAVEAVFTAREKESDQVAGLVGLWMSVAILNDLANEHFTPPPGDLEEDEERERKKNKPSLPD